MEPTIRPVVGEAEYTLTLARAMISRSGAWCKGDFHKDEAFCATGALRHLWLLQPVEEKWYGDSQAMKLLRQAVGRDDITVWNDLPETTHNSVLWAYDTAIEEARRLGV